MSVILDTDKTLARLQGDADFVAELYRTFMADFDDRLRQITAFSEENDFENLAKRAHSLKGVSATVDAEELRKHALELEEASRETSKERVDAVVPPLLQEAERVREAIMNWLEHSAPE